MNLQVKGVVQIYLTGLQKKKKFVNLMERLLYDVYT